MVLEFKSNVEKSSQRSELTFRELLKAQVEGKTVQYWVYSEGGMWVDCQMSMQIHINSLDNIADSKKFRLKPETV